MKHTAYLTKINELLRRQAGHVYLSAVCDAQCYRWRRAANGIAHLAGHSAGSADVVRNLYTEVLNPITLDDRRAANR